MNHFIFNSKVILNVLCLFSHNYYFCRESLNHVMKKWRKKKELLQCLKMFNFTDNTVYAFFLPANFITESDAFCAFFCPVVSIFFFSPTLLIVRICIHMYNHLIQLNHRHLFYNPMLKFYITHCYIFVNPVIVMLVMNFQYFDC